MRLIHPPAPDKPAVFLEEAFKGAAARTSIEPNRDLVDRRSDGGLEDEEEGSGCVIHVNRYETGVHLPKIKVDVRKRFHLVCFFRLEIEKTRERDDLRSVSGVKNRYPSSPLPGQVVGSGTKQLQADETLDATAVCNEEAVDGPTQFAAHDAVPVGANTADGSAVQELQKDSRLVRLAVNSLLNAFAQLFPPQLGLHLQSVNFTVFRGMLLTELLGLAAARLCMRKT